jgi:hypothetical protein
MNPDHLAAWREYLAGQMQKRDGITNQEAQKIVAVWLGSLKRKREACRIPPPSRPRSQRLGLGTKSAASRARSARA